MASFVVDGGFMLVDPSAKAEDGSGYSGPLLMAVPKRKTSKARRDKRRATHAIGAPKVNVCPNCGQPTRPHHVCPTCGTYRGRDVEPLRIDAP